ncbi:CPBP family intramembrane metalloprotease [Burkholderia sp. FERM BP-3421]|uniref:CPBP family intramembrane glutamic endopeptidase n=1 Tax=Burkholderia sp. FERM BP-3421 TaxID=1494466 RepID=UPI00235EA265|nr:CPBP family intramembrane glutamic endopeptidase [Burkholderia sp. FERM BP-3421]WDD94292.1 CPBP family intramembrane metalloprotease [Burkholderia sp. FERM BP-3421]
MKPTVRPSASAESLQPATPRSRFRRVFLGGDGLRAGWAALSFAVLFAAVAAGLVFASHRLMPMPGDPGFSIAGAALMECVQVAAVLIATWGVARFERRSPRFYGLLGEARVRRFGWGALAGIVAISALVLVQVQAGWIRLDAPSADVGQALVHGLQWAFIFSMTGLFEEMLLRGYLQYTLARGLGFWWAALLLSVLFGALHGFSPGETPVGLAVAMLFGLLFCLSLWYTGSLWWAIGFHAAWDWGESFVYGAADSGRMIEGVLFTSHPLGYPLLSGGAAGPEGSVLVLALLGICALVMWRWWRTRVPRPPFGTRDWLAPPAGPGKSSA